MACVRIIYVKSKILQLAVTSCGHFCPDELCVKTYEYVIAAKKLQAYLITGSTEDCTFRINKIPLVVFFACLP